jgi:hypothetical protein
MLPHEHRNEARGTGERNLGQLEDRGSNGVYEVCIGVKDGICVLKVREAGEAVVDGREPPWLYDLDGQALPLTPRMQLEMLLELGFDGPFWRLEGKLQPIDLSAEGTRPPLALPDLLRAWWLRWKFRPEQAWLATHPNPLTTPPSSSRMAAADPIPPPRSSAPSNEAIVPSRRISSFPDASPPRRSFFPDEPPTVRSLSGRRLLVEFASEDERRKFSAVAATLRRPEEDLARELLQDFLRKMLPLLRE